MSRKLGKQQMTNSKLLDKHPYQVEVPLPVQQVDIHGAPEKKTIL